MNALCNVVSRVIITGALILIPIDNNQPCTRNDLTTVHAEVIGTMARYSCSYLFALDIMLGFEISKLDALCAMRKV